MRGPIFYGVRSDPQVDESSVGISFIDVLFALVIGYAITPLATWWKIPVAGWAHLATAGVLTLTSWIGYHNSKNKPRFVIAFFNLAFIQFVLDVAMVVVYAFIVFTAEGITPGARTDAAVFPEAILVFISFVLYVAWDQVGVLIKKSDTYRTAWNHSNRAAQLGAFKEHDWTSIKRCAVTRIAMLISLVAAIVAFMIDKALARPSRATVIGVNVALCTILLLFRVFKEAVTPRHEHDAPTNNAHPPPSESTKV
jgi:hypothetical protein